MTLSVMVFRRIFWIFCPVAIVSSAKGQVFRGENASHQLAWGSLGGALGPSMAESCQGLPRLGHWRFFKVIVTVFHEALLQSPSSVVSASHRVNPLWKHQDSAPGRQRALICFHLERWIGIQYSVRVVADGERAGERRLPGATTAAVARKR